MGENYSLPLYHSRVNLYRKPERTMLQMTANRIMTVILLTLATIIPTSALASSSSGGSSSGDPWEDMEYDVGPDASGGEHVFLKFGNWDAAFGVAWGTSAEPGTIRIVAMQSRYLGLADAYDPSGNEVRKNVHLRIFTIHAVRLQNIMEFADLNGNGIADFTRTGDNTTDYRESEPVFKAVNLNTSWSATLKERRDDPANHSRTYALRLEAADLPYRSRVPVNGTLDRVAFTFHLKATMRVVNDATVPHFDLTVDASARPPRVTDAEHTGNTTASGRIGEYGVKWDHLIEGWDYEARNSKPGLVMELSAVFANQVPPMIVDIANALPDLSGDRATWETPAGEQSVSDATASASGWPDRLPSPLRTPRIHLMDRWTRAGSLTWVTDVEVDGQPGRMYAQVQGGRRIVEQGPDGSRFYGIGVLTGFSYPGGQRIYHDPTVEASAMVIDLSSVKVFDAAARVLPLGMIVMAAVGSVLVLSALMYAKHRGLGPFHYRYEEALDRREPPRVNDWDRAYDPRRKS